VLTDLVENCFQMQTIARLFFDKKTSNVETIK